MGLWCLVGNVAAHRRRQNAVSVGKERRESLVRAKRLCRVGVSGGEDGDAQIDSDMVIDEEQSILEAQTSSCVEVLKAAIDYQYGQSSILYILLLTQSSSFLSEGIKKGLLVFIA